MDREVYLIVLGAGISLASSIVTLLLQFLLSQWGERLRAKREGREIQSQEIRAALLDKSKPIRIRPGDFLNQTLPSGDSREVDLDIPSFLRRKKEDGSSEPIIPVTPLQYWRSIFMGMLVFLGWIVWMLSQYIQK